MKRFLNAIVCLCLLCSLWGCGDGGFKSDMSFTYVLAQNISSLDPQTASGTAAGAVLDSLFEGLCRIDAEGKTQPGVAKSWDENNDSTVFTFHLRGNTKWSDGSPVVADDFVFGITRALPASTNTPSVDDMFVLKNARAVYAGELEPESLGVTAKDDRTLVVELERSYPDFPALTAGIHYMPCSRSFFEQSAGHYGLSSEYLITNGPFAFTNIYSWNTDYGKRSISLSRSEYYRGDHNVVPSDITYLIDYSSKIDTDPIAALKEGAVDILSLPEDTAKAAADQGCGVMALDDAVTGLLLNPQADSLKETSVREVFLKTLDRGDLLSRHTNTVQGTGEASGIMPDCVRWDGEPYYAEGEQFFQKQDDSIDLNALLRSLELEKLPSITVICPNDEDSVNVANGMLVAWNNKLDNAFNIQPLSESEFQSRISSGDYEAALYTLRAGGTTPYDVLKAFESTATPSLMQDTSYDSALHSLNFDLSSYRNLESFLLDACIFYPIFRDNTYFVTNPNVRGITVSPDLGVNFSQARKKP